MGNFKVVVSAATTNLCTNPSLETGTTGWAGGGTNTIAQSSDESRFGLYSAVATYQDTLPLSQYSITLPTASTTYAVSCWVWVPDNWDGGNVQIGGETSFVGYSINRTQTWTATDGTKKWFYIEAILTVAADVVGILGPSASSAPTAGRTLYFDGFQIEELGQATTYCDGDQDGCEWTGTAHASTSQRSALAMSGGFVQDLADEYGFDVGTVLGTGVPPTQHNTQSLAVLPGAIYQNTKVQTPVMTLTGMISAADFATVQQNRKELINAVTPAGEKQKQPVRIRYDGATTDKEIAGYYEGGLEYDGLGQKCEQGVALRLRALDPFWYDTGETSEVLDNEDSLTPLYIIAKIDGAWDALGPPSSVGAGAFTVRSIAVGQDKTVYVAGNFTNWDADTEGDRIIAWDGSAWSALGYGATAAVDTLVVAPDGDLWAGGEACDFGNAAAGDVVCRGIGRWDGTNWNAVGPPSTGGNVGAIAFDRNGQVVVGGFFTGFDAAGQDYVARWTGSAWEAVGAANDGSGTVNTIVVDQDNNYYLGGTFTDWDGVAAADRLVKWDGTTWTAMGNGADGTIRVLLIDEDERIFAGGGHTNYLSVWNGSNWSVVGGGLSGGSNGVQALALAPDGYLYVGGDFTDAGDISVADSLVRWNGHSWAHVDVDLPGSANVRAFLVTNADPVIENNYDVYIGFDTTGAAAVAGTTTVTNPGTAVYLPVITFERSGGTSAVIHTLRNETNGKELLFDYALIDGEKLTLDLRRGQQSITSSYWGRRMDATLKGSNFSDFVLEPGDNTISCFVPVGGGATFTAAIRARAAFQGFDD